MRTKVIRVKLLSSIEQIMILRKVQDILLFNMEDTSGLCALIKAALDDYLGYYPRSWELKYLIPLFSIENASKFEAIENAYWWELSERGNYQRLHFIRWICGQLHDKITLPLSNRDQIIVLQNINWKHTKAGFGLCAGIRKSAAILGVSGLFSEFYVIRSSEIIPLFTIENARPFLAINRRYWWPKNFIGYWLRKQFVNWMIKTLKKQG